MPFKKRFQHIIEKESPPVEKHLYENALLTGIGLFIAISFTIYIQRGVYSIKFFSQTLAWTAIVLIGLSFALSGICYFWDFANRKIMYRKHLGLVGFGFVLIHAFLSLFIEARHGNIIEHFAEDENFLSFSFAIAATLIFAFMAAISNRYAIHDLGSRKWRLALRTGYIAFFLQSHIFHSEHTHHG